MDKILDILIIGAGPIGLACALEAKKAGLQYIVLEKGVLVNSLYHYPSNMTFFRLLKGWKSGISLSSAIMPSLRVRKHWNITEGSLFRKI